MALLMLGWKRALLVVGGLILTEMLGDYVVKPMLMIKGLHVSLLEIMLSLMVWGFLLGPAGAILAIPLTLALRRFIERPSTEGESGVGAGAEADLRIRRAGLPSPCHGGNSSESSCNQGRKQRSRTSEIKS